MTINFFHPRLSLLIWIRDPMGKLRIRDKNPGSATLVQGVDNKLGQFLDHGI
jgi:hypothetical protein